MFAFGAGFFGWPIIWRALDWLNLHYPKWQRVLELRKYVALCKFGSMHDLRIV